MFRIERYLQVRREYEAFLRHLFYQKRIEIFQFQPLKSENSEALLLAELWTQQLWHLQEPDRFKQQIEIKLHGSMIRPVNII